MTFALFLALATAASAATPPSPTGPLPASSPKNSSSPKNGASPKGETKKGIGYDSVFDAQSRESAKKGAVVGIDRMGWMTITNPATHTLWSFAPENTPVYPSAVRRVIVEKDGKVSIAMDVLCQGERKECDGMVQSFQDLNAHIARDFQAQQEKAAARSK